MTSVDIDLILKFLQGIVDLVTKTPLFFFVGICLVMCVLGFILSIFKAFSYK